MRSYGSPKPTRRAQEMALAQWLAGARDHMIEAATVDELVRRHSLDAKYVEYHLTIARQRRQEAGSRAN